jgi:hypothetical protein
MSINQRNPNSDRAKAPSEHGVVHYLALTFSTLLSSQVSGAHRAGLCELRLGATTNIMRSGKPSQIGLDSSFFVHPRASGAPLDTCVNEDATIQKLVGQWVPQGRPPDQPILGVPHPAEASSTLRLSNRVVKPATSPVSATDAAGRAWSVIHGVKRYNGPSTPTIPSRRLSGL